MNVEGVERTIKYLRQVEPKSLNQLRKDIKTDPALIGAISSIQSEIPTIAPLSGFTNHEGRTKYAVPTVKPEFRSPRKTFAKAEQPLVSIVTKSPKGSVGFEIIDMAGRGKGGRKPSGRAMISGLGRSPSRYVYDGFEKKQEGLSDGIKRIIERYIDKVNNELSK